MEKDKQREEESPLLRNMWLWLHNQNNISLILGVRSGLLVVPREGYLCIGCHECLHVSCCERQGIHARSAQEAIGDCSFVVHRRSLQVLPLWLACAVQSDDVCMFSVYIVGKFILV
jgi:hypothetical protein